MNIWHRVKRLERQGELHGSRRDIFVSWSSNEKEPEVVSITGGGQTWFRRDGETLAQLEARVTADSPSAETGRLRMFFINHRG